MTTQATTRQAAMALIVARNKCKRYNNEGNRQRLEEAKKAFLAAEVAAKYA